MAASTMTYQYWHPLAVVLVAFGLRTVIPEPWTQFPVLVGSVLVLLLASLNLRQSRRVLREAIALRDGAVALAARVDAYRDQVVEGVEHVERPRVH